MDINLHNYEEFFLLYADNELSQQERLLVEQFIQENPELEEEFEMINSAIIEPDETFQILDKSFLLKTTGTEFINEQNYEEIFVLFHDGELSEEQKEETIHFLEKHIELKEEFLLIGQAKIEEDPVPFPDKKSLLRKEHPGITGRIIMFRSLAAAAVLGFGLWIAIPYFDESADQPQIAQQSNVPDTNKNIRNSTGKISGETDKTEVAVIEKKALDSDKFAEEKKPAEKITVEKAADVFKKNEKQILAMNEAKKSTEIQPEKRIESTKETKRSEESDKEITAQIPQKEISAGVIKRNEIAHVDVDVTLRSIEGNNNAQKVVYLDVDKATNDNYIFYNVPADEFKKSKVGGFLKKLKRVAERNDPIRRLFELEVGQVVSRN